MNSDDQAIIDHPPPEGWQVIDTIAIMRCLDDQGTIKVWLSNREDRDIASILGDIEFVRETLKDLIRKPIATVVMPMLMDDDE
jgi:hypothetical protein